MAVARRGLARGRISHAFSDEQFLRALDAAHSSVPPTVYAELDGAGRLVVAGAGEAGGGGGAALLAARARLAPHRAASNAELALHAPPPVPAASEHTEWSSPGLWLALRVRVPLAPHDELRVWPAAPLAVPAARLTAAGEQNYECDACDAQFEDYSVLKEHTALSCGAPEPRAFWRRLLQRARIAACPPPTSMEALEALATAWGRARGAHVCVYCGKLYSRRYGLKIHIRTHTGYKPLRCRHCARAFGDPSNLNKHVRLHAAGAGGSARGAAAGAAHACPRCGAVLGRRRDLQRHLRARHPACSPVPALGPAPAHIARISTKTQQSEEHFKSARSVLT